jgi:uncharacterized membrane protein
MDPVLTIALYWLLFGGTHVVLATGGLRARLVDKLGAQGFVYAFSLVAVVTYGLLVHAYAGLRFDGAAGLALAAVPLARTVLYGVSFAGVTLAIAGVLVFPASPMAPPGMVQPGAVRPPRGLARITRHAFFAGIAMMAAAHTLLATRLTGAVFFAGTFLLVTLGAWAQDRKLLRRHGSPYAEYLAATSYVPFAAIVAGRQRLVWRELPAGGLAISLLLAAGLRTVHSSIFAAGGAWMMGVIVGGVALLDVATRLRARRAAAPAAPERARLLAFAAATLVAYVGVAHEVVGTRLYPDGPALLGGPLGWHAVGIAGIAAGAILIAGTLGVLAVPLVPSALAIAGIGALFVAWDAARGGFHFFALTLVIAGSVLALAARRPKAMARARRAEGVRA